MSDASFANRVAETSTTTGTGDFALDGAIIGYRAFNILQDGDTFDYLIVAVDADGVPTGAWELGGGKYTDPDTLVRGWNGIYESSNSDSIVSFGAGTKRVAIVMSGQHLTNMAVPTHFQVSGLSNGDIHVYNSSTFQWEAVDPSTLGLGGATELDELTDVDLTTDAPAVDDVLTFDGTNWVPAPAPGAGSGITAIADASDVDLTGIADNDILVWNAAGSKFLPEAPAGGGGGGGTTLTLIDSVVTSGSQASVDFTSIPGTYKSLRLRVFGRSNKSGADSDTVQVRFNNDSGTNYLWTRGGRADSAIGFGDGSTGDSKINGGYISAGTSTAGFAGEMEMIIPHYTSTAFKKAGHGTSVGKGSSGIYSSVESWLWNDASAINRITAYVTDTFVDGTIVELLGEDY